MKPHEFIDFSSNLAVQPTASPPKSRTVISRAYYGAFHLACELLIRFGKKPTDRHDAHEWLQRIPCEPARSAGLKLADLLQARKRADYRLADPQTDSQITARQYVLLAREIEALLQSCEAEPHRTAIAAEVKRRQQELTGDV
jgi:hypothetical protein